MTPSAAIDFTGQRGGRGDNSGAAAILDRAPDFLPIAQQILTAQRDEKKEIERQQRQADRDWSNIFKTFDLEGIALEDAEELGRDVMGLEDEAIALKGSGADPLDYYGEAGKTIRQKQQNILNKKAASDANNKFVLDLREQVATNPKLDKAHAVKWLKGYDAIKNKGIQAKNDYIKNNNPYRSLVTIGDIATKLMPPIYEEVVYMQGRPFHHKDMKKADISNAINYNDQDTTTVFNQGLEDGLWKTEDEFEEAVLQKAKSSIKDPNTPLALGASGAKGSSSSNKTPTGYVVATDYKDDAAGYDTGVEQNVMSVKSSTGGDMKPIQVTSDDNELIMFQPSEFRVIPSGKIRVKGFKVSEEVTGEPTETVVDGEIITTEQPKKISREEAVWLDYDKNKAQFQSALGFDAYNRLGKKRKGSNTREVLNQVKESDNKGSGITWK